MKSRIKFSPVIVTCPGRERELMQTVGSWAQTDFGNALNPNGDHEMPLIQLHTNSDEQQQLRQEHNALAALMLALARRDANFVLFMADDLVFNRHLRHNLENWKPLREGGSHQTEFFFASLCDSTLREPKRNKRQPEQNKTEGDEQPPERNEQENCFIAHPESVFGSQCCLLSMTLAQYMVEHWWEVPGLKDIKMSRLAARCCPIHYHTPSLVQHRAVQSASGGPVHETQDFSGEFRAAAL
jgi:hypothetical protein